MPPPNILWFCTDQQRFDSLGCYGNAWVRTPHVDRLAREGVLFERCFSQSPICTPSRASFLTGRYPRTTRARQNGQSIPADEILVTRLLAEAGYTGGLSGKLHLSACAFQAGIRTERRINDGYAEFHWSHHPQPSWPANEYIQWLRERGVAYATQPFEGSKHVQAGMPAAHHQTAWCARKAIHFIEAHAGGKHPWFFSVNYFDPHNAFDPPESHLRRYLARLDEVPLPAYTPGELAGKPRFQQPEWRGKYAQGAQHTYEEMSERDHRLVRAAYWAMVDLIDEETGRVLEALQRTGQAENTLIVFMSDHGEMLGDHALYLKGPYFYEPAVRVPLIVAWPGRLAGGRRVSALVELMDIAPTLLDAAGLPRAPGMQARSLLPLLQSGTFADRHREDVYCEYYNGMPARAEPMAHATMVRTESHKLVAVHGLDEGELYDLRADPLETHNLWSDPAAAGIKTALLKRLCDRMAFTCDPLPLREGPY